MSEINDIFGENLPEKKAINGVEISIRKFEWHEFDLAMLIGRFIDGSADENTKDAQSRLKFIGLLSDLTGLDKEKLTKMSLKTMLKLVAAIVEVNNDFFTFLPTWTSQIQVAVLGQE